MLSLIVAAVMLGQCGPGRICPPPAIYRGPSVAPMVAPAPRPVLIVPSPPPATTRNLGPVAPPALAWHWTRNTDGSTRWEWGSKNSLGQVVISKNMPTVPEPTAGATNRPNYGLGGPDRFPSHTGKEWFGGNVQELTGAAPSKPNDRIHLTLIGPESARKSARSTLESDPSFAALATQMGERLAVQDYAPDHPMISGIALPFGGRPDVVIQDARGAVKYRAKDFPGPSVVVAELRKADPNYKPERDPNGGLGLGGLDTIKTEAEENPALCVVILCLLLVLLLRKKA